jgi:hypothetical protein
MLPIHLRKWVVAMQSPSYGGYVLFKKGPDYYYSSDLESVQKFLRSWFLILNLAQALSANGELYWRHRCDAFCKPLTLT